MIAFIPDGNKAERKDGDEFLREAIRFLSVHGYGPERIVAFPRDATNRRRRECVVSALAGHTGLEGVAFFCHGWASGIQAGFNLATVSELASALHGACAPGAKFPLYACSAGNGAVGGDNKFADRLRDSLVGCLPGSWVDAHATDGHCTRNPWVRRFVVGQAPARGGNWIVSPSSPDWKKWKGALHGSTPFRFQFPFLEAGAIPGSL